MASIYRFRVGLGGFTGAPGINTFFALAPSQGVSGQSEIDDFSDQLEAMYVALRAYAVNNMSFQILPDVDRFNIATGALEGRSAISSVWSTTGTGLDTASSRATMAKHKFRTDAVVANRVLQGGIYYGPIHAGALDGTGVIKTAMISAVTAAYGGLLDIVGDLRLAVWHRPKNDTGGVHGYVQSVSCKTLPAVLRSRRD